MPTAKARTCARSPTSSCDPAQLAALLKLIDDKVINPNTGKKVLETMYATGDDPQAIVEREGLAMVSDTSVIDDAIAGHLCRQHRANWHAIAAAKTSCLASSWARSCAPPKARPTPTLPANACKNCSTRHSHDTPSSGGFLTAESSIAGDVCFGKRTYTSNVDARREPLTLDAN